MNTKNILTLLSPALLLSSAALGSGLPTAARADGLRGDYVEARTASVFAGPCHYGGEYMSDGREAVLAWHVTSGTEAGVSLAGLNAVAVVRADANLGDAAAAKTTRLYIDSSATPPQRAALAAALEAACGSRLGTVQDVQSVPIRFGSAPDFTVEADQVASLDIAPLPNHDCCKQPNLVWYQPLAPVSGRMVGYTKLAGCTAQTGGDAWKRSGENSAFYGMFAY